MNDLYQNTDDPSDIVTLSTIFSRYLQINETHIGFEEYVNSGFKDDTGYVEYVPYTKGEKA